MLTWQASAIALALYALALVPIALVAVRYAAGKVAIGFLIFIVAVSAAETGAFERSRLAPANAPIGASLSGDDPRCAEILRLLDQAGWTVDRSVSGGGKIVGPGADQIPDQVAQIVIGCATGAAANPGSQAATDPGSQAAPAQ